MSKDCADYQQIFLNDAPLMDVRAPVEFMQGAFPTSVNLPLMDDSQREAVGIRYKQRGQQAAIELGHSLVSGELRERQIAQWQQFCQNNPDGFLYCFRGGLRSHIVQQWLRESGTDYPLIIGGYKALRNFLIERYRHIVTEPMYVISGNTGCGKTILINEFAEGIDLEGAARHRGSSFGKTLQGQSNQINFENRLATELIKKSQRGVNRWIIEDEGKVIGCNCVPLEIYAALCRSPIAVIDDPLETRLMRLRHEYVDRMLIGYLESYGEEEGWNKFIDYLQLGLCAIRKRLGNERYEKIAQDMNRALEQHRLGQSADGHIAWLMPLLTEYYDPMYTYQLGKKAERIVFRGTYAEVKEFLVQQLAIDSKK